MVALMPAPRSWLMAEMYPSRQAVPLGPHSLAMLMSTYFSTVFHWDAVATHLLTMLDSVPELSSQVPSQLPGIGTILLLMLFCINAMLLEMDREKSMTQRSVLAPVFTRPGLVESQCRWLMPRMRNSLPLAS